MIEPAPIALSVFIFAATLWLGIGTRRPQHAERWNRSERARDRPQRVVATTDQEGLERASVLHAEPVYDFADYTSLLSLLNQTRGVSNVRALCLGQGVGEFQARLSARCDQAALEHVAGDMLGHQVRIRVTSVAAVEPSEGASTLAVWANRGWAFLTNQARSWLAYLSAWRSYGR